MNRIELALRSAVRRSGLAWPLLRMITRGVERRKVELRREYERTRPGTVTLRVAGRSAVLRVTDAEEYAHYLAAPEERIMRIVFENIAEGDTVWDVGANVGMYTMLIAAAVGPSGSVVAFEPMDWCRARVEENSALNGFKNVRAVAQALGKERGRFYMATEKVGIEGDHRVVAGAEGTAQSVEVVPGDELRKELDLKVPNLVKIDVQGAEEGVLLGMDKTLRDPACRAVICEVHYTILAANNDADAPLRIREHLASRGFGTIRRLDRNHFGAWKK